VQQVLIVAGEDLEIGERLAQDGDLGVTAIGFSSVVQRNGLSIPRDLSIVGYHDIPLAARLAVPLTSVRVPFSDIASAAVDALIDSIGGRPLRDAHRKFAPTLIPRASTARIDRGDQ